MEGLTAEGVTRWWLVRHAPVVNPEGVIYGRLDIGCDCGDIDAFAALAAALPRGAVWLRTPLDRTRRTAEELLRHMDEDPPPEPGIEPDLIEQHLGDWQGRTHAALEAEGEGRTHPFWQAPAAGRPPGGESFMDLCARVAPAVLAATSRHAGRDIVAVCHGGPIRAALALALGLDPERALSLRIDTLSLTRLDHIPVPGGRAAWTVGGVNLPPAILRPEPPAG